MSWTYRLGIVMALLAFPLVAGCSGGEKQDNHAHGERAHDDAGEAAQIPTTYSAAVAKCEAHTREIAELIEAGELHDVHAEAAKIQKIARTLPALAKESLPPEMLKDVNLKSKELAGLFDAIDEAADSGDKEGTIRVHERMKDLVEALKAHAGH